MTTRAVKVAIFGRCLMLVTEGQALARMVCVPRWGWRGAGIAVGVAVAAGLGAAGQWWGGLAGAAVIAAGGFAAPEVSGWLKDRRARAVVLDQVSSPVPVQRESRPVGGDVFWLRPEQRVVEFIDRPELAILLEWCTGAGQPALMLMTGAGGTGKTRLALRLAEKLSGQGWLCRMVHVGGESGMAAAIRSAHQGGVLLIVDYAETRPGVGDLLQDIAPDRGRRLRVLLIARGEGEWWARLKGSPDDRVRALVAEAGLIQVGALAARAWTWPGWYGRLSRSSRGRWEWPSPPPPRSASRLRRCPSWCCTRQPCWLYWMPGTIQGPGRRGW
jgi:hypothetical protein